MADEQDILPKLTAALAGRYDIVRELGRGGMATVYLASDVKHDREVAIKVLLPELSATLGAERFEREIRLAAKLQHPHILGMFDSGVADGLLYYVMPFVKGESLRDRIDREGMLPIEDALQIALEVNDALGHAHSAGVIHRDIKPENILLSGGHALVADFGIARAVTEGGANKLTATGMSMGTPYYMAPEQASGETVGPTADLYSLGCVLYEMLSGEPPFTGKNSMQIMARHAMEQVPSIRIVRAVVPEDIENAIFIAMNKTPADRPQNAEQFAQLLGLTPGNTASMRIMTPTMQRRIPSGAQAAIAAAQARRWWQKPAVIAAVVLVAAAGGFALWKSQSRGATAASDPNARRIAILYFADRSRDGSLGPVADGLTEGLTGALSGASSFTVISTTGAARFRGSDAPADSIARTLRAGLLVRGEVEPDGDRIRVSVRLDDATGFNLQRATLAVAAANVVGARDSLAVVVADLIRAQLREQFQISAQRASTSSPDAWIALQRGEAARRSMEAAAGRDTGAVSNAYHTADSLYASAGTIDRNWSDPEARRALLAYRRSRFAVGDAAAMRKWVAAGIEHSNRALAIDPNNADALETRGNLNYWSWLQSLEEDPTRKAALIAAAKTDLEQATTLNRNQAGAYATLSHLYNNYPGSSATDVLLAAQQAYQADEFLAEADRVLNSLFLAAYDLGQFDKAAQWCAESQRRFPTGVRAVRCQLYLLAATGGPSDVAAAWKLADSVTALSPAGGYWRLNSDMIVAMVIARAAKSTPALADSARRVIVRSKGDATIDKVRDLAWLGAMAYTILGDKADAIQLVKDHLAVNPQKVASLRADPGWAFRDLTSEPAFRQLVGAAK